MIDLGEKLDLQDALRWRLLPEYFIMKFTGPVQPLWQLWDSLTDGYWLILDASLQSTYGDPW